MPPLGILVVGRIPEAEDSVIGDLELPSIVSEQRPSDVIVIGVFRYVLSDWVRVVLTEGDVGLTEYLRGLVAPVLVTAAGL